MNQKFHDFHHVWSKFWTIYSDFLFFSNYTGEIDYFWLDFLKMCNINAGPSVNFLFVDHIKYDHNEQGLNR